MSGKCSYNPTFSHVYVEEQVKELPLTKEVLSNLPSSKIIYIKHYKDIFNRKKQDYRAQSKSRSLILAANKGNLIFKGSDMCQDHGNSRFFYAAGVMNCLFDCDYCFLKGMYNTADIVLFVNLEDYFDEVKRMLSDGPMFLSVSYDTDLYALQGIADIPSRWIDLAKDNLDLTIELRTKAHPKTFVPLGNVIYSFTLSPQKVISSFERGTSSLRGRLDAVKEATDAGCKVRLCFDPLIRVRDWESCYNEFMDTVISGVCWDKVYDISVGTFRISAEYIKKLRRCCPMSEVTEYPFVNSEGYSKYPDEIASTMRSYIVKRLPEVIDEGKIFCDSNGSVFGDR